jgi:hypothetical protein
MPKTALEPLFRYDLPIEEDPIRRLLDRSVPWAIHGDVFSQQSFGVGPSPDQGWKLHVSATPLSAVEVLDAALNVLLSEGARFKVVGSVSLLNALNSGNLNSSQIGKFITIYPSDDEQAIRLAVKLDAATDGLRGPRVPTDRPLRPDSLVHYRYGAMQQRPESEAVGEVAGGTYDLLDPAGRLTDDIRLQYYLPPSPEIVDPFEAAGVYRPRPARGTLFNGRYLVNNALASASRGGVFRAVDVGAQPARLCLLKEAWHDVSLDQYGRDARDWAANEEHVLLSHSGDPLFPRVFDSFELDGNRYIAIEYIEGTPLDRVLFEQHALRDGVQPTDVAAIGLATAEALAHLHEIGLVFRDFKPGNVIQTPDGGYRLIDFGLAHEYLTDAAPPLGLGTPPFYSREQFEGEHPSPADDIFAWGAVLHLLACGEISIADLPKDAGRFQPFARRPVAEWRPGFPTAMAAVIDRAVAWERTERYPTMLEARQGLAAATRGFERGPEPIPVVVGADASETKPGSVAAADLEAHEALRLAREVGDALCATAEEHGGGLRWAARDELSGRLSFSPDLYSGAAGIGLFLAELARATGEPRYADAARGAARWLAGPVWGRGRAAHGLHCGEPGVAYFFLRLAELLDERGYVTAAELRVRRLRGTPFPTVDLMYGTAGTILALLRLHAVTGEPAYLADARAAGNEIVRAALPAPKDATGCYWEVASAAPSGAATPYLGLLHGAAGVGLALARLAEATGEERYLDIARRAAELLIAETRHTDNGMLSWPRRLGDKEAGLQAHCHGAGGIGQFFLRLNRISPDRRYREAAEGAARTIAAGRESETRSCACHGISGTGHILLDCYQTFGDSAWLNLAHECGGRLQRFRHLEQPGVYCMNGEGAVSPDLMLGYAGAGSLLLRLANPETALEPIFG